MTDRSATAEDLADLLGELDPLTIERLIATHATIHEVAAAAASIEDEDGFGEGRHLPASPREAEVRAILEDIVLEAVEERELEGDIART